MPSLTIWSASSSCSSFPPRRQSTPISPKTKNRMSGCTRLTWHTAANSSASPPCFIPRLRPRCANSRAPFALRRIENDEPFSRSSYPPHDPALRHPTAAGLSQCASKIITLERAMLCRHVRLHHVAHRRPAHISSDRSLFLPPQRNGGFDGLAPVWADLGEPMIHPALDFFLLGFIAACSLVAGL